MVVHVALTLYLISIHGRVWRHALNRPDHAITQLHLSHRRHRLDAFTTALMVLAANEGGFSNDPADRGGPTLQGVTQVTYDAYRKRKGLHQKSVACADQSELTDIKRSFWNALAGTIASKFPGLAVQVFDQDYNTHEAIAVKLLQLAAHNTTEAKPVSILEMLEKCGLTDAQLCERYALLRLGFYTGREQSHFEAGWLQRVRRAYQAAKSLDI